MKSSLSLTTRGNASFHKLQHHTADTTRLPSLDNIIETSLNINISQKTDPTKAQKYSQRTSRQKVLKHQQQAASNPKPLHLKQDIKTEKNR
ncbi:hypothetical protein KSS94_18055 [Pseudomonas fakonensis]|uniref:Uncharacterized protein n=1 Tax=Pseudomonas fakonensis TaxID=2842355 RepID=A0ABX8N0F1_9PSED|nr:hypothetical protein [Pseudomonas fakonensis]QXH49839.1 hypothetical protein KSS94_18055 [Pseudomonas fakonensis]